MKVWITKHALMAGIREEENAIKVKDGMIEVRDLNYNNYFHGNDWHETKESAISRAEDMRLKAIIALEKKLKTLKNKKFN